MDPQGLKFTHSPSIDPLKRHCSVATIQSEPKGHFSRLIDQLRKQENFENVILQISGLVGNNFELLKFVSKLEGMSMFSPQSIYKKKDEELATKERLIGNDYFKKGKLNEAFNHYSLSIIKATYTSGTQNEKSTLALSLGNRSACLFQTGDYDLATADINFAMSLGYPEEIKYKLYDRLGRCHLKSGNPIKAKPAFLIANQLISKASDIEEKRMDELKKSFKSLIEQCEKLLSTQSNGTDDKISKPPLPDINIDTSDMFPCKEYPALVSKVEVRQSDSVGRHVVATEAMQLGDTVLVENPYAAVLYPEQNGKNCHHCFKWLKAMIPCKKCAGVAYCTTLCRDEADESYHKYECEFQEVLTGLGCSQISRLALRMITIKPYKYFMGLKEKLLPQNENNNLVVDGIDNDDIYLKVHNLVGLTEKRWPEENLIRCALAIVLLSILRASGYFGEKKSSTSGDSFSPNELFFGFLFLRNLQVVQFNAHEVYQMLRSKKDNLKPCKNVVIGLAIYPTASYFNHSCHPGLSRCFNGKQMVLKTIHPLRCGEEVSENYGYAFYLKSRNERRKELSARYWFECGCEACKQDWPLLGKLPESVASKESKGEIQVEDIKSATDSMEKGNPNEALNHIRKYVAAFYKDKRILLCQDLLKAEDKARSCISNLGNVVFTEDLILRNEMK